MKIFISYSRVDKAFALRLGEGLRAAGYNVWLDLQNIPHGTNWDLEVQRGLETSDVMLVLLSPTASASENVKDEWNYFIEKKRRIIPVMIAPNDVPFRLSRRQRVDFVSKPYEQAFNELLAALEEKVGDEARPAFQPRSLAMSWGDGYSLVSGLRPSNSGDAVILQNELRLLAPGHLPFTIPLTSITGAAMQRSLFDNYIVLRFVDRASKAHQVALMGTDRKNRNITQREFLTALGSVTGKNYT